MRGIWLALLAVIVFVVCVMIGAAIALMAHAASPVEVVLQDTGIAILSDVPPAPGPVLYRVTNEASTPRGLLITGKDSSGCPIQRYTEIMSPGDSATVHFHFYAGREYTYAWYKVTPKQARQTLMVFVWGRK